VLPGLGVRAKGRRLRAAAGILAEPRGDPDPPSDEELHAFIEVNGLSLVMLSRRHFEPLTIFGLTLL
jgi:hypothetical protein